MGAMKAPTAQSDGLVDPTAHATRYVVLARRIIAAQRARFPAMKMEPEGDSTREVNATSTRPTVTKTATVARNIRSRALCASTNSCTTGDTSVEGAVPARGLAGSAQRGQFPSFRAECLSPHPVQVTHSAMCAPPDLSARAASETGGRHISRAHPQSIHAQVRPVLPLLSAPPPTTTVVFGGRVGSRRALRRSDSRAGATVRPRRKVRGARGVPAGGREALHQRAGEEVALKRPGAWVGAAAPLTELA